MGSCTKQILVVLALVAVVLPGCQGMKTMFRSEEQSDIYISRAKELMKRGQMESALDELEKAIATDPHNVSAYTAMGDVYRKEGKLSLASRWYEDACHVDRYAFRPHYNLGVTYQALADLPENMKLMRHYLRKAVDTYIRALVIRPDSFEGHMNLAACYFQMGQYALAEQNTLQALELSPDSAQAHSNLGIIYETTGQYDQAIGAYKSSIESNPGQPDTLLNLGLVYLHLGRMQSALSTFQTATHVAPDWSDTWLQLGLCCFYMKKLDRAVQAFQQAIRLDPGHPMAYRGLGVVCMYQYVIDPTRADLRDKALEAWRFSLKLQGDQDDLRKLIQRYASSSLPVS